MTELQCKILDIFTEIDKLCKKHNLRYFAIGGTCLGAVRHQGFIPWDDDLDIAMPREDYEKFKIIAQEELPEHLKLFGELDGEHNICKFIKIHNINTTFIEHGMKLYRDRYTGVYVDIMPLDGVPNKKIKKFYFFITLRLVLKLDWVHKFYHNAVLRKGTTLEKIIYELMYVAVKNFPANYFSEKYIELQKKYSFNDTRALSYTWSCRAAKIVFTKEDFDDYVLLPFENIQMRCPAGYDDFLKTLFGDYMRLPPEEQRVACHSTDILDLRKPYVYYIEKGVTE